MPPVKPPSELHMLNKNEFQDHHLSVTGAARLDVQHDILAHACFEAMENPPRSSLPHSRGRLVLSPKLHCFPVESLIDDVRLVEVI